MGQISYTTPQIQAQLDTVQELKDTGLTDAQLAQAIEDAAANPNAAGFMPKMLLDTSSLTNDNDHIPTSGVVKSALTGIGAIGNTLTPLSDANDVTVSGVFYANQSTLNIPASADNRGMIFAVVRGALFKHEVYYDYTNSKRYERFTSDGSTWTTWEELVTKSAIDDVKIKTLDFTATTNANGEAAIPTTVGNVATGKNEIIILQIWQSQANDSPCILSSWNSSQYGVFAFDYNMAKKTNVDITFAIAYIEKY